MLTGQWHAVALLGVDLVLLGPEEVVLLVVLRVAQTAARAAGTGHGHLEGRLCAILLGQVRRLERGVRGRRGELLEGKLVYAGGGDVRNEGKERHKRGAELHRGGLLESAGCPQLANMTRRGCCGKQAHSLFGICSRPTSSTVAFMARRASRAMMRAESPPLTKDDLSTREGLILAQAVFELGVHEWHRVVQILNGHSLIHRPESAFTPESTEAIWRAMMTDAGVELYAYLARVSRPRSRNIYSSDADIERKKSAFR